MEKTVEAAASSGNNTLLIATLAFGAIALLFTSIVHKKKSVTVYFVKLFGLVFIATLAAAIVFGGLDEETRTGAYTILGAIAGYLAGSKVEPGDGGDGQKPKPAGEKT
jgi:hypothetical protein